jgi:WD40 repeat protein
LAFRLAPSSPFTAPEPPSNYVPREAELRALKTLLLAAGNEVAISTALHGAGGFGKTTLACAVAGDESVRRAFPDGVLWVTLGETPSLTDALHKLYEAITLEHIGFRDLEDARQRLTRVLANRHCLIIIDDVWSELHLRPFRKLGANVKLLFTTRDTSLTTSARTVHVDAMTSVEAESLLLSRLATSTPSKASAELAVQLGRWPLLLNLAAAMLSRRVSHSEPVDRALTFIQAQLRQRGITAFDERNALERDAAVANTMSASLDLLSEQERRCYNLLAIFPEDVDVPIQAIAKLWAMSEHEAEAMLVKHAGLGLLRLSLASRDIRIHDVFRHFILQQLGDCSIHHKTLLNAWGSPFELPDAYAWRFYPYHCAGAQEVDQLTTLLFNYRWIFARLEHSTAHSLIDDFKYAADRQDLMLLKSVLRLSSHAISSNLNLTHGQLYGRLVKCDFPNLVALRADIAAHVTDVWLRPLNLSLALPTSSLEGMFRVTHTVGHAHWIRDTSYLICLNNDKVSKWDIDTYLPLFKRSLKSFGIRSRRKDRVVLASDCTRDGNLLVLAMADHSVVILDIAALSLRHTLTAHSRTVKALAITNDDKLLLTGSSDGALRLWDLQSGTQLRSTRLGNEEIGSLAVGNRRGIIISGLYDTLYALTLPDLKPLWNKRLPDGALQSLVIPTSERHLYALTSSSLVCLELLSGKRVGSIDTSDESWNEALLISNDERHAISGSFHGSLRLWDLYNREPIGKLRRHASQITCLQRNEADTVIISASVDGHIRKWRSTCYVEAGSQEGHFDSITGLAWDGRDVLSASADGTVRRWRLSKPDISELVCTLSEQVDSFIFSRRLERLVASTPRCTYLIDSETNKRLHRLQAREHQSVLLVLADNVNRVVSAAYSDSCIIWGLRLDSEQWIQLRPGRASVPLTAMTATQDAGEVVMAAEDSYAIDVWSTSNCELKLTLEGHTSTVTALEMSSNNRMIISGSSDGTVRIWDRSDGSVFQTLRARGLGGVTAVAISFDRKYVLAGGEYGLCCLWRLADARLISRFQADAPITRLLIGKGGRIAVIGDAMGSVYLLELMNHG